MIDLTRARNVLLQAEELLEEYDGLNLDDTDAISDQGKKGRNEKAQASKDLIMLADKLELAARLVKDAYWVFKGETDSLTWEPEDEVG